MISCSTIAACPFCAAMKSNEERCRSIRRLRKIDVGVGGDELHYDKSMSLGRCSEESCLRRGVRVALYHQTQRTHIQLSISSEVRVCRHRCLTRYGREFLKENAVKALPGASACKHWQERRQKRCWERVTGSGGSEATRHEGPAQAFKASETKSSGWHANEGAMSS